MPYMRSVSLPKAASFFAVILLVFCLQDGWLFPDPKLSETFQTQISSLINQPKWESSFWGIHIVSLKDGSTIYSLNSKKRFLPASNMKLLIAAAALDRLGPDFAFDTPVFAEGRIDSQGRILGNLVLAGRGDPNLEGRVYKPEQEDLARADFPPFIVKITDLLISRGIQIITGDIVADDTFFLHEPYGQGWSWEDLSWRYGAPVSALAVSENYCSVEILPGEKEGDPAWIRSFPFETGLEFINKTKTVEKTRRLSIGVERSRNGNEFVLEGEIPLEHSSLKYDLAIPEPAEFASLLLKSALNRRGISVIGKASRRSLNPLDVLQDGKISIHRARALQTRYPEDSKIGSITTAPLSETIKIMLKVSHNLYAEMLLRVLGARTAEGLGATETGIAALEEFLEKTGTSKNALSLKDGSGLSRRNLVTPESIVRLLEYMDKHPYGRFFLDSLPIAGVDGTLKNRMLQTSAAGRIHAKTGSIESASTLSGYAYTRQGERLAFSIIINNETASGHEVREVMDKICQEMVKYDFEGQARGTTEGN